MANERMRTLLLRLLAVLWLFTLPLAAQTPVALAPSMHPQFLDATGKPLSSGFIYTYQAGTTTRQDTYTDSTGSIANAWPIPLDSTGAPSNGSTQTGIWLSNNAYKFCGYSSALVQQWCTDNVSAYQILQNIGNITFGSVTVDPTGAAGEIGYRSDLGCLREYTTFWDCLVTYTGIQTLTNKTFDISANTLKNSSNTAGHYPRNNGTQYVDGTIQAADIPKTLIPNLVLNGVDTQTGASYTIVASDEQQLVTFNNAAPIAVTLPQATTTGFGSGTSFHVRNLGVGTVTITPATSTIDGVATFVLTTGQGADIYSDGTNYVTQKGGGAGSGAPIAGAVNLTAQAANIPATTIMTPAANGFYRASCYLVVTQAAATSSTLPACVIGWTDSDTSTVEGVALTSTNTSNTVGTIGSGLAGVNPSFYAKSGTNITYSTNSYASFPVTSMQYAIRVRLEGPF